MTWKEVKVTTLQKMFAIEGDEVQEEQNRAYLAAMPAVAMEGLALLLAAGKGPVGCLVITHQPEEDAPAMVRYDLASLAPDFGRLKEDGLSRERPDEVLVPNPSYGFEGEGTLLLPKNRPGIYRVPYFTRPPALSAATPDDFEMGLSAAAPLLPLYMASQLYKDDDLSLATLYRNEFEVGLETLKVPSGTAAEEYFTSESGWM